MVVGHVWLNSLYYSVIAVDCQVNWGHTNLLLMKGWVCRYRVPSLRPSAPERDALPLGYHDRYYGNIILPIVRNIDLYDVANLSFLYCLSDLQSALLFRSFIPMELRAFLFFYLSVLLYWCDLKPGLYSNSAKLIYRAPTIFLYSSCLIYLENSPYHLLIKATFYSEANDVWL